MGWDGMGWHVIVIVIGIGIEKWRGGCVKDESMLLAVCLLPHYGRRCCVAGTARTMGCSDVRNTVWCALQMERLTRLLLCVSGVMERCCSTASHCALCHRIFVVL